MSLLDRYLAREILLPFAAGLLFLTQILLATTLLSRAEILFGSGVSAWDVASVLVGYLPHFLGYVLPIAFLLGAMLGVGRLAEDREVIALGAAGISPLRLVPVPLLLAVLTAATGIWLSLWAEPATLRSARLRLNDVVKKNVRGDVRPGTFSDDIPGYTLYAERVEGSRWENVLIHDRSTPSTPVLALARSGRLEPVGAGEEMQLRLDRGEIHREDAESDDYLVAGFEHGVLSIGLGTALSDRTNIGRGSNELTIAELRARATPGPGNPPEEARRAASFLHRRIASPLAVIPFALLAVPLGASRRAGRAFGVGATIFAVLAHYLLLRTGEVLAQGGTLPPPLSLELPNLVLSLVALALIAGMARRGPGAVR